MYMIIRYFLLKGNCFFIGRSRSRRALLRCTQRPHRHSPARSEGERPPLLRDRQKRSSLSPNIPTGGFRARTSDRWKRVSVQGSAPSVTATRGCHRSRLRMRVAASATHRTATTEFPVVVHRLADEALPVFAGPHLLDLLGSVMTGRGEDAIPSRLVGFDVDHRRPVDHVHILKLEEPPLPETAQPHHGDGEGVWSLGRAEREDTLLREVAGAFRATASGRPTGLVQPADQDEMRVLFNA